MQQLEYAVSRHTTHTTITVNIVPYLQSNVIIAVL